MAESIGMYCQDLRIARRRRGAESRALLRALLLTAFVASAAICPSLYADDRPWLVRGSDGMVASDSAEASAAGAEILRTGGNAFDAAIATSLVLGLTRPESTGLGGGGFMVAYCVKEKRLVALDFREKAPRMATPERYEALAKTRGDGPSASIYGGNAIGVPGLAHGYGRVVSQFGTMKLEQIAKPAIKVARDGFEVDEFYERSCAGLMRTYEKHPDFRRTHTVLYDGILRGGKPPVVRETVKRPDLARAIEAIAEGGPSSFYGSQSAIAREIVQAAENADGTLNYLDLEAYAVREREPVVFKYRGYEIAGMPPPSSGGVCIAEVLQTLDRRKDWSADVPQPLRSHLLVEAMKHAFADRARWLGDPDQTPLITPHLLDPSYAAQLAGRISAERPAKLDQYGTLKSGPLQQAAKLPDDHGTSHFCVADKFGNVVAWTETINGSFGSLVMVEPFGIILNNQMDDFTTVKGEANLFKLVQSDANLVGAGKRPLSSMSPTIVFKEGKPVLALGASGGPRIISAVIQVLLNVIEFDMPLDDAMTAFRVHHQWQPDELNFQHEASAELEAQLERMGHTVGTSRGTGAVTAIQFLGNGAMVGSSDPRKAGRPAAVKPR